MASSSDTLLGKMYVFLASCPRCLGKYSPPIQPDALVLKFGSSALIDSVERTNERFEISRYNLLYIK